MVILLFNTIWHYLIHYSVMLRQFLGPKYCHHQLKCPDKSIGGGGNIITAIIEENVQIEYFKVALFGECSLLD